MTSSSTSSDKTKIALQVVAGVLEAVRPYCVLEISTKYTLHHKGERIGVFTLDEALDLADAALTPEKE